MNSLYKMFETDQGLEQEGIKVRYGDIRFIIARAGGNNVQFRQRFQTLLKPYRRQIDNDTLDENVAQELMAQAYAETVIKGWQSIQKDEDGNELKDEKGDPIWINEIPNRDDVLMPYTVENCKRLLLDLKELFADIQFMASKAANFLSQSEEEDSKNSSQS